MNTWLHLSNQVAIVTGAASGIGAIIARALSQQNCSLLLSDHVRCMDALEQLKESILRDISPPSSTQIRCIPCDVTQRAQVLTLVQEADELAASIFKKVSTGSSSHLSNRASILVNSAGITRDRVIQDMSDQDFDSVVDVNLKGTFLTCQAFCSHIRLQDLLVYKSNTHNPGASIINIGSIISQSGNIGQVNYAASKGGVVGLTRALAKEMAHFSTRLLKDQLKNTPGSSMNHRPPSIRVNCILPGFIDTCMTRKVPEHIRKSIQQKIALHHLMGQPDDVANLALFLASSLRSGYITGQALECTGMLSL